MIQLAASSARLAQPGVDMSLPTLILSILALVVSVTALGWQFVSWWKSGPAVGTDTLSGMVIDQPEHPEVLILVVNSRGRLPITVEQWGFVIKDTLYGPAGWTSGPEVPHRMEPDSEARWC